VPIDKETVRSVLRSADQAAMFCASSRILSARVDDLLAGRGDAGEIAALALEQRKA